MTAPHAAAPRDNQQVGHRPEENLATDLLAGVNAVLAAGPVIVASDFDGVLAPLVDNPEDSRMTEPSARAIAQIALGAGLGERVHLALVSGRPLDQLFALASPPVGTHLSGSHGAEKGFVTASALNRQAHELTSAQQRNLATVTLRAQELAARVEGAWVELKPGAAVLHTRLAPPELTGPINRDLLEFCQDLDVHAMAGKDVVEVAVQESSKGAALTALRTELGAHGVIYLGDDVTDETVFEVLGPTDVGVKVGPGPTAAKFSVSNISDVELLLSYIADKVAEDC